MRFVLHYMVRGVEPERDIKAHINGHALSISVQRRDEFGRAHCIARPIEPVTINTYRAKIGLFCGKAVVPAEENPASQDRRLLSFAMGVPEFV